MIHKEFQSKSHMDFLPNLKKQGILSMLHNLLKQSITSIALYSIFKIIIQSFEGIQALIEEVRNLFQSNCKF